LVVALLVGIGACGPSEPERPTIDREVFIAVLVDLRMAALGTPDASLPPQERARILSDHELTEEELVTFAEVHGDDPDYMVEVWREVEARMNVPVDSAAGGSPR